MILYIQRSLCLKKVASYSQMNTFNHSRLKTAPVPLLTTRYNCTHPEVNSAKASIDPYTLVEEDIKLLSQDIKKVFKFCV